jgi:hypothetical protein
MSVKKDAISFFLSYQTYYEGLLRKFPQRSEVRWWHKLLRIKPRGEKYQEVVEDCKSAINALKRDDFDTAINSLDKLICWYRAEAERFSESISEIATNYEIRRTVEDMRFLRKDLLDLKECKISRKELDHATKQ